MSVICSSHHKGKWGQAICPLHLTHTHTHPHFTRPGGDYYRGCICVVFCAWAFKRHQILLLSYMSKACVLHINMKKGQYSYDCHSSIKHWQQLKNTLSELNIKYRKENHGLFSTWLSFQKVLDSTVLLLWFMFLTSTWFIPPKIQIVYSTLSLPTSACLSWPHNPDISLTSSQWLWPP